MKDFLLKLKMGDTVIVKYISSHGSKTQYITVPVVKLSKARFTLNIGPFTKEFKMDGNVSSSEKGFDSSSYTIIEETPEIIELIKKQNLLNKIRKTKAVIDEKIMKQCLDKQISELNESELSKLLESLTNVLKVL